MLRGVTPRALRSCVSCAEQTDGKLCCARCHTLYCSRACQKTDWTSGRDTNLEMQSRALVRVAHMSGGAPDDAHCLFCLDQGDATDPSCGGARTGARPVGRT